MNNTEAINGYLATIAQHGNPAMDVAHWSDFVNRVQGVCAENAKLREMLSRICPDEHTINTGFSPKEVRALLA